MKSAYDGLGYPRVTLDELVELFRSGERPEGEGLIGAESEKIGVHRDTGEALGYGQAFGVCKVIGYLREHHGWAPIRETEDGPVLGLTRDEASITLEPGAQFELSGAPLPDIHAVARELKNHLQEIAPISERLGIQWLGTGFHPLAAQADLPWVPKQRYPVMRRYLPEKGHRAHDMMLRTATVQANFDRKSERDGMEKVSLALRVSPLVHALFANSPFVEGRPSGRLSERGDVWLHMDPSRSGLIPSLWNKTVSKVTYQDYVEWALDSGMFLFWRGNQIIENTGQTFRDFLSQGYQGHHATIVDFKLHLTTLFPEVRLKNTIEVRCADGQHPELMLSLIALWTGLLYDDVARSHALDWVSSFQFEGIEGARPELVRSGLSAQARPFGGIPNWEAAERLVQLASGGLHRRGRGEAAYLDPLLSLMERRIHPADVALERYGRAKGSSVARIVEATRLEPLGPE
jgi:glutamate--cysteine ligase